MCWNIAQVGNDYYDTGMYNMYLSLDSFFYIFWGEMKEGQGQFNQALVERRIQKHFLHVLFTITYYMHTTKTSYKNTTNTLP